MRATSVIGTSDPYYSHLLSILALAVKCELGEGSKRETRRHIATDIKVL